MFWTLCQWCFLPVLAFSTTTHIFLARYICLCILWFSRVTLHSSMVCTCNKQLLLLPFWVKLFRKPNSIPKPFMTILSTQKKESHISATLSFTVVSPGIEPGTQGFSVLCSLKPTNTPYLYATHWAMTLYWISSLQFFVIPFVRFTRRFTFHAYLDTGLNIK